METLKNGLALSGGGFRATLYALGSLIRMNEDGLLTELDTITAVSGGAITAGYLMLNWNKLNFEKLKGHERRARAINFEKVIVRPLLEFCSKTIVSKRLIVLHTLFFWTSPVKEVENKYTKLLFGNIKLKDIQKKENMPEFVFYATNLDTGASVRISDEYIRDYNIGIGRCHNMTLAQAVAISSAFPPFLSPIELDGSDYQWENEYHTKLPSEVINKLRKKLSLCDGGLYDNLGLEMLWKHGSKKEYNVVFCCDSGSPFSKPWDSNPFYKKNWLTRSLRASDIMINQQRALRKRALVRNLLEGEYIGTYWSIENEIIRKGGCIIPHAEINDYHELKNLSTQLKSFGCGTNEKVVNLGYYHTDSSLNMWYKIGISVSHKLPF
ncbi:patatin-like phospholipase family protein [Aeromonas piscicola]|uniref:Patatin-like phospholipase family protein n=1 Tax=Aeromonas piscicola TaxID=600645 RepID=A0ABT7QBV6_9GAMM|nr:patatin-like phospholipase family protein [Aeromonas piscicola]MDM5131443.1 patatin-like phospholipase family protein [Aeromonas piscicola]